jgi:septation ring formation regulator EzrA
MGTIQDQKKLTEGKGWKNEKIFTRESPYKAVKDVASKVVDVLTPTTVKKVREKIQKIKDKKKRGPRDE